MPRSPVLRRILLVYTINELGTWLGYVALMIGVYDHTHSALATAGTGPMPMRAGSTPA